MLARGARERVHVVGPRHGKFFEKRAPRTFLTCTQTDAATIATRRAETRIAGLGRAGPSARTIERGPTEGREPPKSFVSGLNVYA
jgi:hypothetical protein